MWRGKVICSICDFEWTEETDDDGEPIIPLECPKCKNQTGQPE